MCLSNLDQGNAEMATGKIQTVFISYAHENDEFRNSINELAIWLRARDKSIHVYTDHMHNSRPPEEGWRTWMENKIEEANVVLIVCTEKYYRRWHKKEEPGIGKGVTWEGAIITQDLFDSSLKNKKYFPILPDGGSYDFIPKSLRDYDNHHFFSSGNEGIYDLITKPVIDPNKSIDDEAPTIKPKSERPASVQNSKNPPLPPNKTSGTFSNQWIKYTILLFLMVLCGMSFYFYYSHQKKKIIDIPVPSIVKVIPTSDSIVNDTNVIDSSIFVDTSDKKNLWQVDTSPKKPSENDNSVQVTQPMIFPEERNKIFIIDKSTGKLRQKNITEEIDIFIQKNICYVVDSAYPKLFDPFRYDILDSVYVDNGKSILKGRVYSQNTQDEYVRYSWLTKRKWLGKLKKMNEESQKRFKIHNYLMGIFQDPLFTHRFWAVVAQNWVTTNLYGTEEYTDNGFTLINFDFSSETKLSSFKIYFSLWFYKYQYANKEIDLRSKKLEHDMSYFTDSTSFCDIKLKKAISTFIVSKIQ